MDASLHFQENKFMDLALVFRPAKPIHLPAKPIHASRRLNTKDQHHFFSNLLAQTFLRSLLDGAECSRIDGKTRHLWRVR